MDFMDRRNQLLGIEGTEGLSYIEAPLNCMFLNNKPFLQYLKSITRPWNEDGVQILDILRNFIAKSLSSNKQLPLEDQWITKLRYSIADCHHILMKEDPALFIERLFDWILYAKPFYQRHLGDKGYVLPVDCRKLTGENVAVNQLLHEKFSFFPDKLTGIPYPAFILKLPMKKGCSIFASVYLNEVISLKRLCCSLSDAEVHLYLSAVICVKNQHFTSFVKFGNDWFFLDSMDFPNVHKVPPLEKLMTENMYGINVFYKELLMHHAYLCFYTSELPDSLNGHESSLTPTPTSGYSDIFPSKGLGVEGINNSCYIDSTLNCMFLYDKRFLNHLLELNEKILTEKAVKYLQFFKEEIVTPLHYNRVLPVATGGVVNLRRILSHLNPGFLENFMDVEEFISTLFDQVLEIPPFYKVVGGEGGHVFTTHIVDEKMSGKEIEVKSLLRSCFADMQILLEEIPKPAFIIKLPVCNGQRMFSRVSIPMELNMWELISSKPDKRMSLFGVICLNSHHFTAFVKRKTTWLFLDSMKFGQVEKIRNFEELLNLDCPSDNKLKIHLVENAYVLFYEEENDTKARSHQFMESEPEQDKCRVLEKDIECKKEVGDIHKNIVRGIYGNTDSSSLDSILNSLFLSSPHIREGILEFNVDYLGNQSAEELFRYLNDEIFMPLLTEKFVPMENTKAFYSGIYKFLKGNEEKIISPGYFVEILFRSLLKWNPFFRRRDGFEGYVFDASCDVPITGEYLHFSKQLQALMLPEDRKFADIPRPALIVKVPKKRRIYFEERIDLNTFMCHNEDKGAHLHLSAVICRSEKHYTSFIFCNRKWYFLDSSKNNEEEISFENIEFLQDGRYDKEYYEFKSHLMQNSCLCIYEVHDVSSDCKQESKLNRNLETKNDKPHQSQLPPPKTDNEMDVDA